MVAEKVHDDRGQEPCADAYLECSQVWQNFSRLRLEDERIAEEDGSCS